MRAEIVPRGYLPIVLGDLNDYDPDVPDRDESRRPDDHGAQGPQGFRSGPPGAGAGERGVEDRARRPTATRTTGTGTRTAPTTRDDVYTMIDHILLAKELMPYVTRVFICHSVSDEVSDHFRRGGRPGAAGEERRSAAAANR